MGQTGLPAFVRAVPARLFQRPPRGKSGDGAAPGNTLVDLIGELSPGLRGRALTHSSWVEDRADSNERLEFLGDSVLGLAIALTLCRRYPESPEGELARLKAFVVSRASCAQVAERLGIAALLEEQASSPGAKNGAAPNNRTVLGNSLEALIGAVFLTFGFEQTRAAVEKAFAEQIRFAATTRVDHKTALQELLAARGLQPSYSLAEEAGPPHARVFTSEVSFGGTTWGRGTGSSIKMSEQAAAKEALALLDAAATED